MEQLGVRGRALRALVIVSLLAAACAPQGAGPEKGPAGPRILRNAIATFSEETLDPTRASIAAALGLGGPMWEWLTEIDGAGKLRPWLADSWTESADGRAWEFKLHPGVRFHDGIELTAEDVQFTLMDALRRPESRLARTVQFKNSIKSVDIVDKYTFKIVTNNRWITLPYDISQQPGTEGVILPKQYITKVGWDAFAKSPVGSGPWKFVRFEPGNILEFEAVKDHWRTKPQFDRLQTLLVPEVATRIAMLRSGEADVASITLDSVADAQAAGLKVIGDPDAMSIRIQLHGTYLPTAGPLGNVKVREALNVAINREEMVKTLFHGRGEPATVFPIGKSSIGFPQDLRPYPYDPARARRVLAEAGFLTGLTVKLYSFSTAGFSQYQQMAEAVAGYWQAVGVKTTIVPTDLAAIGPKYLANPPHPDVVGAGLTFATAPRLNGLDDFTTFWTQLSAGSRLAKYDDYVKRTEAATTVDEIAKIVQEGYRAVYNDYQGIPIANADVILWAYGKRVGGIQIRPHRGFIEPSLASASFQGP